MIRTTPNLPAPRMNRPSAVARPFPRSGVQRVERSEAMLFLLLVATLGGVLSHYSRVMGALLEHLPTVAALVVDLIREIA